MYNIKAYAATLPNPQYRTWMALVNSPKDIRVNPAVLMTLCSSTAAMVSEIKNETPQILAVREALEIARNQILELTNK